MVIKTAYAACLDPASLAVEVSVGAAVGSSMGPSAGVLVGVSLCGIT